MDKTCHSCSYCGCFHHKIIPIIVLLIGALFLLGEYGAISQQAVAYGWPSLLMLAGVTKLVVGKCQCYKK